MASENKHLQELSYLNMDVFFVLEEKRVLIESVSKEFLSGKLLDLGCGIMPYKEIIGKFSKITEYIGVDIKNEVYQKEIKPDLYWDGEKVPFESNTFNSAILIEVLEHVPQPQMVLNELSRVLDKDGILLLTVPFLWNLHDVPYDEHRYTPFALKRMLELSGFEIIKLETFGGWHASFAQVLGLYLRRGYNGRFKNTLSKLFLPIIKYLRKKDAKNSRSNFYEGQMITGLWCIAKKK